MAIIKAVNSRASIGKAINYVTRDDKTEEKLISGKDCCQETAIDEMKATKAQWDKTEGRQYKHFIQSFDPEDKLTPEKAHQIGREWAEKNFKGYEVVIATHRDKDHIHNHFIINSVSFEDGRKFQQSKKDLQQLKNDNDRICEREGLSVIREKSKEITAFDQKKFKAIEKGLNGKEKSYVLNTGLEVNKALNVSRSREEFIKSMESKGYQVNWTDSRKYITYTTPEGQKIRSSNLEKTFKEPKFSKEGMENEIQRNRANSRSTERTAGIAEITTGDNETAFIHGDSGANQIHSKRADELIPADQKEHGNERETDAGAGAETTGKRERESRVTGENQQRVQGYESGNEAPEGKKQPHVTRDTPKTYSGDKQQREPVQGNNEAASGIGSPGQKHSEPILEGQGEAIRDAAAHHSRDDSGNIGNSPAGGTFGEILKSLSKAIERADREEKAIEKAKQERQVERQMQREANPKKRERDDLER